MKPTTLLLIFTFFAMPGIVYAESGVPAIDVAFEAIHELVVGGPILGLVQETRVIRHRQRGDGGHRLGWPVRILGLSLSLALCLTLTFGLLSPHRGRHQCNQCECSEQQPDHPYSSLTPWLLSRNHAETAVSSAPLAINTDGVVVRVAIHPATRLPNGIPPRNATM